MAHAFNVIPAKPTFGTIRQKLYQSDYISRKKALLLYCNSPLRNCQTNRVVSSYDKINSFNLGRYTYNLRESNVLPVSNSNLVSGQFTKLDLERVCSVTAGPPTNEPCSSSNPCNPCQNSNPSVIINPSAATTPFYYDYIIDPLGELFGRSQCGELNYVNYRVLNHPTKPLTISLN